MKFLNNSLMTLVNRIFKEIVTVYSYFIRLQERIFVAQISDIGFKIARRNLVRHSSPNIVLLCLVLPEIHEVSVVGQFFLKSSRRFCMSTPAKMYPAPHDFTNQHFPLSILFLCNRIRLVIVAYKTIQALRPRNMWSTYFR